MNLVHKYRCMTHPYSLAQTSHTRIGLCYGECTMCSVSRYRNKAAVFPVGTLLYIWHRIQYVGCDFFHFISPWSVQIPASFMKHCHQAWPQYLYYHSRRAVLFTLRHSASQWRPPPAAITETMEVWWLNTICLFIHILLRRTWPSYWWWA